MLQPAKGVLHAADPLPGSGQRLEQSFFKAVSRLSCDPSVHANGGPIMKTIVAAVFATLMLVGGALAAPGDRADFYPSGHESFTGQGQESGQ